MMTSEELKELCKPPGEGKAYYRPFVCNGDIKKVDIFFVGINPATPIFPKDMNIDDYVKLLSDYESFINYYKLNRTLKGKNEFSRTRIGMNSFFDSLRSYYNGGILETDVVCYPTPDLRELKKEPKYVIEKGKDIFYKLIVQFKPKLIIFHGKKSVDYGLEVLINNGVISNDNFNLNYKIEEMEKINPLVQFNYMSGGKATIMACRHFMYYGIKGESFETFRNNVINLISFIN